MMIEEIDMDEPVFQCLSTNLPQFSSSLFKVGVQVQMEEETCTFSSSSPLTPVRETLSISNPLDTCRQDIHHDDDDNDNPHSTIVKLYDRQEQTEQLRRALFRRWPAMAMMASQEEEEKPTGAPTPTGTRTPELILISGSSGTGKSVLARQVLQQLVVNHHHHRDGKGGAGGYCVMGKFDQLNAHSMIPEPYSAFVGALTGLAHIWQAEENKQQCEEVHKKLRAVAEDDAETWSVLRTLVPALDCVFLPSHDDADATKTSVSAAKASEALATTTRSENEAQPDRIPKTFKLLFRSIFSSDRPLVMLLDDLQWADSVSLELLESLASDPELLDHLLLVGICRSNEVPWNHEFASLLRRLEDERETQITHVMVQNLSLQATTELIADTLQQLPGETCRGVAERVHAKTDGNVFFVLQLLRAVQGEGVLTFERRQQRWVWHDELWKRLFGDNENLTVIDLVLRRMKRLPEPCQTVLKIASCIGAEFETSIVVAVAERMDTASEKKAASGEWESMLQLAQDEHMILARREYNNHEEDDKPKRFVFLHDRIQQSAYALIPEQEHPIVHLSIGRMLYEMTNMPIFSLDDHIFLVANQLVLGASLLTSDDDKTTLALLCLEAGRKATTSIDFRTAVQYFQLGVGFLPGRRPWRDEYKLCLELYTSLAEAQCCTTDFEAMNTSIDQVLLNARNKHDKHRAYTTKIYAYAARLKLQEAIDLGIEVLRCYGEKFPSKPCDIHVGIDMIQNMWLLRGKSNDVILHQTPTIDVPKYEVKVAAMELLHLMTAYAFIARRQLAPLLLTRLVHITLKYGLCAASSAAFALHGTLVIFIFDDVDSAYRYGDLGIQLMEQRFPDTSSAWLPRVYNYFYSMIAIWKLPIQTCIDKLFQAYVVGRRTGDSEAVAVALLYCCELSFFAGRALVKVKGDFVKYLDVMALCKQGPYHASSKQLFELVLNLTGESESLLDAPATLLGSTIYEDHTANFGMHTIEISIHGLILNYHLGNFEEAHKMAKRSRVAEEELKPNYVYTVQFFYDAMSSLALGWTSKRRKRLAHAGRILRKLEKLANHCPNNMRHKVCLVQAEMILLKGKKNCLDKAMCLYKQAVESATEESFLHIRALALERAGWALRRKGGSGRVEKARQYLEQSLVAYEEWGAHTVAKSIQERYFISSPK